MKKSKQKFSLGNKTYDTILTEVLKEQAAIEVRAANHLVEIHPEHIFSVDMEQYIKN